MCTGIRMTAKNGDVFWGRTMDLNIPMFDEDPGFEVPSCIVTIPSNTIISSQLTDWKSKYAVLGVGLEESTLLYDGINEHGLAGDGQVLKECTWRKREDAGEKELVQVLGEEFVSYILTNYKNTAEIRQDYRKFCLIDQVYDVNGTTLQFPMHFSFINPDGTGIVLEPVDDGQFKIYDFIGVMANSPEYNYHTTNIRNYIGLDSLGRKEAKQIGQDVLLKPIEGGTGYGLFGLPGDYTSPSRFIRSFFIKNYMDEFESHDGISQLYAAFRPVIIPRGLEHSHAGDTVTDYTRYWSGYDLTNRTLYVQSCRGLSVTKKSLDTTNSELTFNRIDRSNHFHTI
ncbi:linear amide C-N hydrolase [Vagococcus vulneris]|uniref:Linear amide C-N hydrolase n=1 Tax=Vagococcus vulneris TaxID=1977869 RepID=A0A430A1Q3_9ENTE|nr:linear amide C-N hydrolase [Vagococcus vulneris]RSU00269.1 linear amide C-N hydrolase [Vagococcus vulneris]